MSNKAASVYAEAMKQNQTTRKTTSKPTGKTTGKATSANTQPRPQVSDKSREVTRSRSRKQVRQLPTRDEVQELSFRLRDSLNVKAQAEIPHEWQQELNGIAHDMNVRKLELYRFIYAEFLGKVARKA